MAAEHLKQANTIIDTLQLSGETDLDEQIKNWILWDRNSTSLKQIITAVKAKNWEGLRLRLCKRLSFETSGLQATMRAGFDSINDLVVVQIAQGICKHLTESYPSIYKRENQGIVIGYDGRYQSKRYAHLSAVVFLNTFYKVYLFRRSVVTPFVPFTIRHKKCLAGIMITGSQLPKMCNGFKLYWTSGALALPRIEEKIDTAILSSLEPQQSSWDLSILRNNVMLQDPYREINAAYFAALKKLIPISCYDTNQCSQQRFVYSALHGVGYDYIKQGFQQAKLNALVAVAKQCKVNAAFPTVKQPDSNRSMDVFNLAKLKACEEHVSTILIHDPDAAHLAVAELDSKLMWKRFSCHEVGALLGWWALESYKMRVSKHNVSNCVMLSSLISSKILAAMAKHEGFTFIESPIDFTWMGNRVSKLETLHKTILFAYDQNLGFMFSTNVLDADGVSAAVHLATMANQLRTKRHMTLIEKLHEIYHTYGYHAYVCSYFSCADAAVIVAIFERLRSYQDETPGTYPPCIMRGLAKVLKVRDLTVGVDSSYADGKARLPVTPRLQLITFNFTHAFTITLLGSERELKLSYYAELCGQPEQKDWEQLQDKLNIMVDACIEEFYQPAENGLIAAASNT